MRASDAGRFARRLVVSSLVSGAVVAAPLAAQPAAAASSWDTNRTEEFSKGTLPKGCNTYGGAYEGGKSYWKKEGVKLSGGLLRLRLEQKSGGKGYPYTSGGVGCWDWAQQYGRFEVRAKVPQGKGIDSYITLMPSKPAATSWTGIELLAPGPETAYITNGYGADQETARMPGTYSDAFHTYVIEWAPNLVRMSVDDAVVFTSTKSFKGKRWLGMVVSNGDALTGVPDATTKLPAEFEIDYVKTATFTGVAPAPKATVTPPPAGATGAKASATPLKVPATTPSAAPSAAAVSAEDEQDSLAGGVWPWLLGGSMIAGLAVVSLSYPRGGKRRGERHEPDDDFDTQQPSGHEAPRQIDLRGFDAFDAHDAPDDQHQGPRTGPINVR